jgi:GNAT superfamily N-acetyltransferase
MQEIHFHILQPNNTQIIQLIAHWYHQEWKVPVDKTIQRLHHITADPSQLQVVLTLDNLPVATGGMYDHVSLLDKEPRFKIYKHWLALVYTLPDHRQKGYGVMLCNFITAYAKQMGIDKMYLFTHTTERLYARLGWAPLERLFVSDKHIVIMSLDL